MYQITIDGLSGSGKSSVARKLAERLGIMYFDDDLVIAGLASVFLGKRINPTSEDKILDFLKDATVVLEGFGKDASVIINGEDVSNKLNNKVVQTCAYTLSKQTVVEKYLRILQLKAAQKQNLVVEGYNTGTTLFPRARYKFFLKADSEVRAQRKYEELTEMGVTDFKYEDILRDTEEKDNLYFSGEMAKIDVSEDTHFIDTSNNTSNDTVDQMLEIIQGVG